MNRDTFIPIFFISFVTGTVVETIITKAMWDTIRIGRADVMIGTESQITCILCNNNAEQNDNLETTICALIPDQVQLTLNDDSFSATA